MPGPAESVISADDARRKSPGDPFVRNSSPAGSSLDGFQNDITRFIERHSRTIFISLAVLYLISFNGQWRIGLDSANYRGLADSIASGRGYTFGDWAPHNIYPGLPLLLAGLQIIAGKSAVLPCIAMLLMGAATLVVTYRLTRLHFPKWVAVIVTFGLGTNSWFLQETSDLMTDVPFALGVVMALYGWDRVRLALRSDKTQTRRTLQSGAWLMAGIGLSAIMRPTFLVLVGAFGAACAAGILFSSQRRFYAIVLAMLISIWATTVALDPRTHGFHPLSGGYEREATEMISSVNATRVQQLLYVLNDQLPAGFFGEQLALGSVRVNGKKYSPTSILGSLLVIGAPLFLVRKNPMWALLAWGTVGATILYAAEPRYYLMAMPILIIAWLLMVIALARRLPKPWSDIAFIGGLLIVTLNNFSSSVGFVREQRSTAFLEHYKKGKWLVAVHLADLIVKNVAPNETVIGPSGSVLSYLSGRHVYSQREIFKPHEKVERFPLVLASKGIRYAIFPAPVYRDKEPGMARMMERGVLRPVHRIAEVDKLRLCTLRVVVPSGDWQHQPKLYGSAAQMKKKPAKKRATTDRTTTAPTRKRKRVSATTAATTAASR